MRVFRCAYIVGWPESVISYTVELSDVERLRAGAAHKKILEDVRILFMMDRAGLPYGKRLFIHGTVYGIPDIFSYERGKDIFYIDNFTMRLFPAVAAFAVVISIIALVYRISQYVRYGFSSPFAAAFSWDIVRIEIIGYPDGRAGI